MLSFRPATSEDKPFVDAMQRRTMTPYVEKTWASAEERAAYFVRTAFDAAATRIVLWDGVPAARVSILRDERGMLLDNLHVLPEFQSKGIGAAIIRRVFDEARREGLLVHLSVLKANPARALYERLGFRVYEESATHYFLEVKDF